MLKTQNFLLFEKKINIGQEAGPLSKISLKISYFQISQELISLGKKQRVNINWQKIPYKKGLVYFFAKINGFATVGILMKKNSQNITFFLQNL